MAQVSTVDTFVLKISKAEKCLLLHRGLCHCQCLKRIGTILHGQYYVFIYINIYV